MNIGLQTNYAAPTLYHEGLVVTDCSGILTGNTDLASEMGYGENPDYANTLPIYPGGAVQS